MARYFTHYWSNSTYFGHQPYAGEPIRSIGSNLFQQRNIVVGDRVYPVTVLNGTLYLLGALDVGLVCDLIEASNQLGVSPETLWDAADQIVAASSTPLVIDLPVTQEITQQLRFLSGGVPNKLFFSVTGSLDKQTLRGVREITHESATILDNLLPPLEVLPTNPAWNALSEEVDTTVQYPEGAVLTVTINRYERNPKARQACIDHYSAVCQVCLFSFEDTFGEMGKGYIHVHHTVPLSTIGQTYEVNPIEDLCPVCPNCHAMLHRKFPPYTVEELQSIISANRSLAELL